MSRLTPKRPHRRRPDPEVRKLEILKVATDVFLERGYEAGAMAEVARRLGGSKETLYRYFGSKQALFAAIVREGAVRCGRRLFGALSESNDLPLDLRRFARAFLTVVTSDEHLALRRAVIAEVGKSDLGKLYFDQGWGLAWELVAGRMARAMEQGRLRPSDPWTVAMHFRGLCQAGLYDMRLEGLIESLSPKDIARAADDAVDVFLRAYAVRRSGRG